MIGIISDTHENMHMIVQAVEILKQREPEIVFHLGDLTDPIVAQLFHGLNIKYIRGNMDFRTEDIRRNIQSIGGEYLGEFAELAVQGKRFALYHGDKIPRLDELINSRKYDYVLHGHLHRRRDERIGNTRVISPGNFFPKHDGHGFAFLDIEKDELEFVDIKDESVSVDMK